MSKVSSEETRAHQRAWMDIPESRHLSWALEGFGRDKRGSFPSTGESLGPSPRL